MPGASPPREPRRNSRPMEEEYVLYLSGIPPQCRWQELKDFVRQTALHIRQAVVYDDQHGHPTGVGQIIVKNEDEAWRTYNRLSTNGWNGQSLKVTLARASAPTEPIAGPTKSPSVNRVPYMSGYSTTPMGVPMISPPGSPPCTLVPETPVSPTFSHASDYGPFYNAMNGPCSPPMISVPPESMPYMVPAHGAIAPQPCFFPPFDPHNPMAAPQYHHTPVHPVPTDSHRGSLSTQSSHSAGSVDSNPPPTSQNIFIQYLNPDTTLRHLKEYLESAGTVEKCDIQERKPIGGRPRVFATATFQTVQEAKQAISSLDNSIFRGAKIRVRFDRDPSGSSNSGGNRPATRAGSSPSASPSTPTRSGDNETAKRSPSNSGGDSVNTKDSSSPGKNNAGPLVINGSSVGLKTGRTNVDMVCHEEDLSQKTREIRL